MLKPDTTKILVFFFFSQQPIKSFQIISAELDEDVAQSYFTGILTRAKEQLHRHAHCTCRGTDALENSGLLSILLIYLCTAVSLEELQFS